MRKARDRYFRITSLLCFSAALLIWFLPGSYSYRYLGSSGTELYITSLFAFFPFSVVLPLILAGVSGYCLLQTHIPRGMLWTVLIAAVLQCLYLGVIEAICLPFSHGETFIWLQALPFPLTIAGTGCILMVVPRQNSTKKENFFKNNA